MDFGYIHGKSAHFRVVTEGWLEIDKHYSLELCFSIEILKNNLRLSGAGGV